MARDPSPEDLKAAALHFLRLVCRHADSDGKRDPVVAELVGILARHEAAGLEEMRRKIAVELVRPLADVYAEFQRDPDATAYDLQDQVLKLLVVFSPEFSIHLVSKKEAKVLRSLLSGREAVVEQDEKDEDADVLDTLVPTREEIVEQGGPVESATLAVAELLSATRRSIFNWRSKPTQSHSTSALKGSTDAAVLRYALTLFNSVGADGEQAVREWLQGRVHPGRP